MLKSSSWSLASFVVMLSFMDWALADWPGLRGSPDHSGFVQAELRRPFRLVWTYDVFDPRIGGERLGTAMEPIVAGGKVFIATHSGHIHTISAENRDPIWEFHANGPFLHSPAVASGTLVAASVDGNVYALSADTGKLLWNRFLDHGGCAASPLIAGGRIFIGTRSGVFFSLNLSDANGWQLDFQTPIRQTAAFAEGRVFVTGEDLKVRCLEAATGKLLWTSDPLAGQTARDYYPILMNAGGRSLVIVRTNPILNMADRIGRDRTMLARSAGFDDGSWQKVESWINRDDSHGTPELWSKEQRAIIDYLGTNRDARTFFVLDAQTGREALTAPILWIGGCQGVGAEPALTADGRLLVFYRSAYGNWNHGVAPLVTLGLYDLSKNLITPLFHQQGRKPAWNSFWGTADESQSFLVGGQTVLINHQGTLSGFDLKKGELFPIHGERDTFGGFRSPAWARNEWHGPARAGLAIDGTRLYWQTGSRILCLASGEQGKPASATTGIPGQIKPETSSFSFLRTSEQFSAELARIVRQVLSKSWAPLFVEPGLAGRDFSFADSSQLFEALSWAYPLLPRELQNPVKERLDREWSEHFPCGTNAFYSLKEGEPREPFDVPREYRARLGGDKQPHPFGGLYSAWFYGERCGEQKRVLAAFPEFKKCFEAFLKGDWKLDPIKGDLFANRYLAALLVYAKLAGSAGDSESAALATKRADETADALVAWWERATGTLTNFNGSAQLDPFISGGDAISFRIASHRHKIALFHDLTPSVAALVRARAPAAVETVWNVFNRLYATWHVTGEERQVHFGENYIDPPDLALNGFKALTWLRESTPSDLFPRVDIPFCKTDLFHVIKLALALEKTAIK